MEAATQTLAGQGVPGASLFLRALSDKSLVKLAAGGSDDAFTLLYQRHHGAVYAYCVSILRDSAEAEDALHEVMMRTLQTVRGSDRDIAFKPWLFRCARNHCFNILQRRAVRDDALYELQEHAEEVDSIVERKEEVRSLLADVAGLPEQQKAALLMREACGLSHIDIADALDTDTAKAKRLLFEARRTLSSGAEGRETACAEIRFALSEGDGRTANRRDIRSHLKACEDCRAFKESITDRRNVLAAGLPILGPELGMVILANIFHASAAHAATGAVAAGTGSAAAGMATAGGHVATVAGGIGAKIAGAGLIAKGVAVIGASAVIATGGVVTAQQVTGSGDTTGSKVSLSKAVDESLTRELGPVARGIAKAEASDTDQVAGGGANATHSAPAEFSAAAPSMRGSTETHHSAGSGADSSDSDSTTDGDGGGSKPGHQVDPSDPDNHKGSDGGDNEDQPDTRSPEDGPSDGSVTNDDPGTNNQPPPDGQNDVPPDDGLGDGAMPNNCVDPNTGLPIAC